MRTNVRDTSLMAYDSVNLSLGQRRVVDFMKSRNQRDWTRAEIARDSGIPINVICGRVHELVGKKVLEEWVRRNCRITGKQAHPVRLARAQVLLPLESVA